MSYLVANPDNKVSRDEDQLDLHCLVVLLDSANNNHFFKQLTSNFGITKLKFRGHLVFYKCKELSFNRRSYRANIFPKG